MGVKQTQQPPLLSSSVRNGGMRRAKRKGNDKKSNYIITPHANYLHLMAECFAFFGITNWKNHCAITTSSVSLK